MIFLNRFQTEFKFTHVTQTPQCGNDSLLHCNFVIDYHLDLMPRSAPAREYGSQEKPRGCIRLRNAEEGPACRWQNHLGELRNFTKMMCMIQSKAQPRLCCNF